VRALDAARRDALLVEALVELGEAQVVGDVHAVEPRFGGADLVARGIDGEVERAGGTRRPCASVACSTASAGSIVILPPGK
jgi:hypothetical protein